MNEIILKGLHLNNKNAILKYLRLKKGKHYNPHDLNLDLTTLHELKLFNDIQVEKKVIKDKISIVFQLSEKEKIRLVQFHGTSHIKEIEKLPLLSTGSFLDISTLESDKEKIRQYYIEKGYININLHTEIKHTENKQCEIHYTIEENKLVKVGKINFGGNKHFSSFKLRRTMDTKIDRFYNHGTFNKKKLQLDLAKIKTLYQDNGFINADVQLKSILMSENKSWAYINIGINEGPKFKLNKLSFEGNQSVNTNTLIKKIKELKNKTYTKNKPYELLKVVEDHYSSIGKLFTIVNFKENIDEVNATIDIHFTIKEGGLVTIEEVKIFGNHKTREVVIRRDMLIFPGDRFDGEKIKKSKRRLMNLGIFESVEIEWEEGSSENKADIHVYVKEQNTGQIGLGLGYSSQNNAFVSLKYRQSNFDYKRKNEGFKNFFTGDGFIGDGQSIGLEANTGTKKQNYSLSYHEPRLWNKSIHFGWSLFSQENDLYDYHSKSKGASTFIGKEIWEDVNVSFTYDLRNVNISDIQTSLSHVADELRGRSTISSLTNKWSINKTDNNYFPTDGWKTDLSFKLAGAFLGGSKDFIKANASHDYFKTLFETHDEPHIFHSKLKFGYSRSILGNKEVPIQERFYAGGFQTVRGFEEFSLGPKINDFELGGNYLNVLNLEYSFPIFEKVFRGKVFYDQGYVWDHIKNASWSDMRSSYGLGIDLRIPAGPFRNVPINLNYALPIRHQPGDDLNKFSFNFGYFF